MTSKTLLLHPQARPNSKRRRGQIHRRHSSVVKQGGCGGDSWTFIVAVGAGGGEEDQAFGTEGRGRFWLDEANPSKPLRAALLHRSEFVSLEM